MEVFRTPVRGAPDSTRGFLGQRRTEVSSNASGHKRWQLFPESQNGTASQVMNSVAAHQVGHRLMDDLAAVDGLRERVHRHAGHLRLEQIAGPKVRDRTPIPRRKPAMDVPAPSLDASKRVLRKLVDAVRHQQIRTNAIQEFPDGCSVEFTMFNHQILKAAGQFGAGEKSLLRAGASCEVANKQFFRAFVEAIGRLWNEGLAALDDQPAQ